MCRHDLLGITQHRILGCLGFEEVLTVHSGASGDAIREGLADAVKVMVADAGTITNSSSDGVREKWIFLELRAHVYGRSR